MRAGRLSFVRHREDQGGHGPAAQGAAEAARRPKFRRRARSRPDRRWLSHRVPGIGGTGVVTINALLATAAWIDGLYVTTLDQTGTAQKGGAVVSHLLLSRQPVEAPNRTNIGNADVILGFDLLGVANAGASEVRLARTHHRGPQHQPDADHRQQFAAARPSPDRSECSRSVKSSTRRGRNIVVDANRLAEGLFGSHMAVNLFMVGHRLSGRPDSSFADRDRASRSGLNEVDIERNLQVFDLGPQILLRRASLSRQLLSSESGRERCCIRSRGRTDRISKRGYAKQYSDFVEMSLAKLPPALEEPVARYFTN